MIRWLIVLIAISAFAIDTGIDNEICSAAPDLVLDYASNYAGFWNPNNECLTLIRFDDERLTVATIVLTVYRRYPGNTYQLYEIIEAWDSYVTWNTQPDTGDNVGSFTILPNAVRYEIDVDEIPEYGWMVINDEGETPPVEIWSFESRYPPRLEFPNRTKIDPVSLGRIKAVYR